MFWRISLLTVDGLRPSSFAMARILRPAWQEVRGRDPLGLGEKAGRNRGWSLTGDGSDLFDVAGLQNKCVTVPPSSAGTTADSDDLARFGIAQSLFQLILVGPCSVLGGAPCDFRGPFTYLPIATLEISGVAATT